MVTSFGLFETYFIMGHLSVMMTPTIRQLHGLNEIMLAACPQQSGYTIRPGRYSSLVMGITDPTCLRWPFYKPVAYDNRKLFHST